MVWKKKSVKSFTLFYFWYYNIYSTYILGKISVIFNYTALTINSIRRQLSREYRCLLKMLMILKCLSKSK